MAQEGIATLPMQEMPAPDQSQGIGAFNPEAQAPEVTEKDRFDAVMTAIAQQNPEMAARVKQLVMELNLSPTEVEQLKQVIAFLEQNKDNYPAARQSLIQQGIVDENELPPQYSEETMVLLKMVVYATEAMAQAPQTPPPQQFNKGGLAQAAESLRQKGRGNDTVLAHINPAEAQVLQQMGGSGRINPNTGLPEFGFLSKIVGKVLGVADKVFGSDLTNIIAQVGGFMIGGPTGAALASAAVTYGRGGSLKDMLLNAGTAYIGGQYGPMAGAAAGAGSTLLKGGSLKDAAKGAAISAATSWGMQDGTAKIGQTMQDIGNWWNNTPTTPTAPTLATSTGAPVSASDVSATGIANQSGAKTDFGLNAGPAPSTATSGIRTLGQDMAPVNYGLQAPPTTTTTGLSVNTPVSAPSSGGIGSGVWDWAKANPMTATAAGLGIAGLAGGFTPKQPPRPGIVDTKTGTDYINANPNKYLVQNLPGVTYGSKGEIVSTGGQVSPTSYSPSVPTPAYGAAAIPNYSVPFNTASQIPGGNINQPYNINPYAPYMVPRVFNQGGISQVYPRRTGQIAGPGTETSDDIPAMLSDGEFVVTAKAVRGIGNGSRREGAKKLYRMMHAMEKKAGGKV